MNCNEARPLLNLMIDDELNSKDAALVVEHLSTCSACVNALSDVEDVHRVFAAEKDKVEVPSSLHAKIQMALKAENVIVPYVPQWKIAGSAAAACIIVAVTSVAVEFENGSAPSPSAANDRQRVAKNSGEDLTRSQQLVANASDLIDKMQSDQSITINERQQLTPSLGFTPRFLNLPAWQMTKMSVYRSGNVNRIARFDFKGKDAKIQRSMVCYQGPRGAIASAGDDVRILDGKSVAFGTHSGYRYARWTQNDRDYLMVTQLSRHDLESIVQGA